MPTMPNESITVVKTVPQRLPKGLIGRLRQAVKAVLRGEGIARPVAVSLVLCDDETIQQLNRAYLAHDSPTDVLSFPMADEPMSNGRHKACGYTEELLMLGEIVISVETAKRNAERYRQSLEQELLRLAVHGTLHLLGYDDATPQKRRRMQRKERRYLRQV